MLPVFTTRHKPFASFLKHKYKTTHGFQQVKFSVLCVSMSPLDGMVWYTRV